MLRRKIEAEIAAWIEDGKTALLLTGVRQAGKTFVVRKCLDSAGCNFVEFNLIEQPRVADVLNNATGTDDLILKLSLISGKRLVPGETFIFFDEVQRAKEVVAKIKFLVEDGRFRYVLSGSLLGVELANLSSAPVGYLRTLELHPLDFEEFLQIFDIGTPVLDSLRASFADTVPVDDFIHTRMMELFNLYLIIGGMPAAVEAYRRTGGIDAVMDVHESIAAMYKMDFTQYEAVDRKLAATRIYEMIPAELNEKNKRFTIADIRKNLRYDRVSDSFTWLWKAGVALAAFNVTEPAVPLLLNEKSSLFKVFLADTGMLTTMYGKECKLRIVNGERGVNKGAVFENAVAQELHAHGYPLYYYNSKAKGELDFVIEHAGRPVPIEVKSGKDYERHSALNKVLAIGEYGIERALVFANTNARRAGRVTYLPLYLVMFLHPEPTGFADISLERYRLPS